MSGPNKRLKKGNKKREQASKKNAHRFTGGGKKKVLKGAKTNAGRKHIPHRGGYSAEKNVARNNERNESEKLGGSN